MLKAIERAKLPDVVLAFHCALGVFGSCEVELPMEQSFCAKIEPDWLRRWGSEAVGPAAQWKTPRGGPCRLSGFVLSLDTIRRGGPGSTILGPRWPAL